MSVSIMECLQNADYNLRNNYGLGAILAREQLHNATVLLDKGYSIWTEVEPLIDKYGTVEDVPEFNETKQVKP